MEMVSAGVQGRWPSEAVRCAGCGRRVLVKVWAGRKEDMRRVQVRMRARFKRVGLREKIV
jgi:hypothetical protein